MEASIGNNFRGHRMFFKLGDELKGYVEIRRIWLMDTNDNDNYNTLMFRQTCVINEGYKINNIIY